MTDSSLSAELVRRQCFADQLEAYFRAHPLVWISILELQKLTLGGPSWRSRIVEDLREKRSMDIPWNKSSRESAYMFRPDGPALGRDAAVPAPDAWPIAGAPYHEAWTLTPPESR